MSFWASRLDRAATVDPRAGQLVPVATPFVHEIRGWTEDLIVSGELHTDERLSDVFNRREMVTIVHPSVRRLGVLGWPLPSEDKIEMDPFDFDLVLGGPMSATTLEYRAARRIHKVRYPVVVAGRTFEVRGTMHLFPGLTPEYAAQRTNVLFLPLTNAVARHGGSHITDRRAEVVLVNRYAITSIRQLDAIPA
jgi:hypothetical protein